MAQLIRTSFHCVHADFKGGKILPKKLFHTSNETILKMHKSRDEEKVKKQDGMR